MSDQPASCPLCRAILRQSRNLRRHLELLHFGLGSNNKSTTNMRQRRTDRNNDIVRSTLASICEPHLARTDQSKAVESTDLSTCFVGQFHRIECQSCRKLDGTRFEYPGNRRPRCKFSVGRCNYPARLP